jgi:hypothetical protein
MSASGTWAIRAGPAGYDRWVSFPGHGSIIDPVLNIDGEETQHQATSPIC